MYYMVPYKTRLKACQPGYEQTNRRAAACGCRANVKSPRFHILLPGLSGKAREKTEIRRQKAEDSSLTVRGYVYESDRA